MWDMYLVRINTHLSKLIIALMVWACLASPMSAIADISVACDDIHKVSVDTSDSGEMPSGDTSQEGSDHPFHHCGSCHNHIMGETGGERLIASATSLLRPVPNRTVLEQSGPDGPYRPPRA
jgi:hypothetical protein|tara:strand:- start:125 stop:487 length:363 start_codon:yes stop_codon:yes gene_type:complete